jgi:surface antigen
MYQSLRLKVKEFALAWPVPVVVLATTATLICTTGVEAQTGLSSQANAAVLRPWFDRNDEAAALEAVQVALTEVGDGSSYVWYRHGGRLSGIVQPTQSFEDAHGRVCRHLMVTLSAGAYSRRTGAIACRLGDGTWVIDG